MKIAEALARRKDLNTAISDYVQRIMGNATAQEGDQAPEKADTLLQEAAVLVAERARLTHLIFAANLRTSFAFQGRSYTLSEALAEMERLKAMHGLWEAGVTQASPHTRRRYSRDEIREERVIDYGYWQGQRAEMAKQMRQLDLAIQQANWTLDLEPDAAPPAR